MLQFHGIHLACIAFVFFVSKQHARIASKKKGEESDGHHAPEDYFMHLASFRKCLPWFTPLLLSFVCMALLFNHENTSRGMHHIIEWFFVTLIYIFTVQSVLLCANPHNSYASVPLSLHATLPITFLCALVITYFNVIHPRYHTFFVIFSMFGQVLLLNNRKANEHHMPLTTTVCVQSWILALCVFFICKSHLFEIRSLTKSN